MKSITPQHIDKNANCLKNHFKNHIKSNSVLLSLSTGPHVTNKTTAIGWFSFVMGFLYLGAELSWFFFDDFLFFVLVVQVPSLVFAAKSLMRCIL